MLLFVTISIVGYALYALAPSWSWVFAGLLFVTAWSSMASPTLFSVIGDALPSRRRAMGFTVQSMLKRVPIAIAPTLGGLIIAVRGLTGGIRISLLLTIALAILTVIVCGFISIEKIPDPGRIRIAGVWNSLPRELRRLLLSDVFIRTCEGMVDVFLVLYATNVIGVTAPPFGFLVAIQMLTSMAAYVPAGHLADRTGRKPLVVATFVSFALFPIAVVLSGNFVSLIAAFVIGGLREVGEPARKAMIVDMVQPAIRARSIGLYYLVRSLAISPAAFIGGLLWNMTPAFPFLVAGAIGLTGAAVFAVTVNQRYAG